MSNLKNEGSKVVPSTPPTRKELVSALINTHNLVQNLILHAPDDAKCQCGGVLYINKRIFDRLDNNSQV